MQIPYFHLTRIFVGSCVSSCRNKRLCISWTAGWGMGVSEQQRLAFCLYLIMDSVNLFPLNLTMAPLHGNSSQGEISPFLFYRLLIVLWFRQDSLFLVKPSWREGFCGKIVQENAEYVSHIYSFKSLVRQATTEENWWEMCRFAWCLHD